MFQQILSALSKVQNPNELIDNILSEFGVYFKLGDILAQIDMAIELIQVVAQKRGTTPVIQKYIEILKIAKTKIDQVRQHYVKYATQSLLGSIGVDLNTMQSQPQIQTQSTTQKEDELQSILKKYRK